MTQENIAMRAKKNTRTTQKKQEKLQTPLDISWKPSTMDIVIQYDDRIDQSPKILKDYKVYLTSFGGLIAKYLIEQLKAQKLLKQQSSLSFYCESKKIYIYTLILPLLITTDPQHPPQINPRFISKNTIKIKIRNKKKIIIDSLIQQQRQKYDQIIEDEKNPNSKGQKQKKIGEVVQKVALWRKFYTGFYDQDGNYFQKPLQSAAQQVGIAKKTLDDYLLQIRNGKKYGFNFNQKYNCKIGQLRAFVRDQKKKAQEK